MKVKKKCFYKLREPIVFSLELSMFLHFILSFLPPKGRQRICYSTSPCAGTSEGRGIQI